MNRLLGMLALLSMVTVSMAAPPVEPTEIDALKQALTKFLPTKAPDEILSSPVKGLYEVRYGPKVFYATADGRFLIDGSIYDLNERLDITEPRAARARIAAVNAASGDMIVFKPKETRHTLTVFTDVDCSYCRLLHSKMDEYLAAGIEIRYLLYPRAAVGSETYKKAVSVWCADDRHKALTEAKSGAQPALKACDNPVERNMMLGRSMGVSGTPALLTAAGDLVPGYVPPAELVKLLEKSEAAAAARSGAK